MELTDTEKQMLDGSEGAGVAQALEYQIALGEVFNAESMVEITRAHAPLTQLPGDNWFASELLKKGACCKLLATTNPTYDVDYLKNIGTPEPEQDATLIADVKMRFKEIGLVPTYSCTPQLEANIPRVNEIVAFSESSAVPYVNGVLGARTNRESAKSALAAAITGRVPVYGLLQDENRFGDTLVTVKAKLHGNFDYRLLGYTVGMLAGNCIPVFEGIPTNPSEEQLLNLCTDLNVSAAVAMLHIVGVTPEAPNLEAAFGGLEPSRHIIVTDEDLRACQESMSAFKTGNIDFVLFGCAHYTLEQVREVANLLRDKTLAEGVELWVLTSPQTKKVADEMGYVETIMKAGGHVMPGSCSVMPCWDRRFDGKTGVTDSLKAKFYNSAQNMSMRVMRMEDCIAAALKGSC